MTGNSGHICQCFTAVAPDEEAPLNGSASVRAAKGWVTVRHVPYIFAAHDCISGIASGMTTKYASSRLASLHIRHAPRCWRSLPALRLCH